MAVLRNGSKCSHTACMLRFFSLSRLALNPNLIFEIGSMALLVVFSKQMHIPDTDIFQTGLFSNRLAAQGM